MKAVATIAGGAAVGDPLLALANGDFVSAVWHEAENRFDQIRKLY